MESELFLILLFKESSVHNIREFFKQQRIRDCMRYFLVTLTILNSTCLWYRRRPSYLGCSSIPCWDKRKQRYILHDGDSSDNNSVPARYWVARFDKGQAAAPRLGSNKNIPIQSRTGLYKFPIHKPSQGIDMCLISPCVQTKIKFYVLESWLQWYRDYLDLDRHF